MSSLPQVNATLTAVGDHSGGFSADYDRPASPTTPKWTGESGAYLHEKMVSTFSNGALNRVKQTTLYVNPDLARAVEIKPGDTLSYTYRDYTFSARVKDMVVPRLSGVPNYAKITFEEVNAS